MRRTRILAMLLTLSVADAAAMGPEVPLWDHERHWYTVGAAALAVGMLSVRFVGSPNSSALIGPSFDGDTHQLVEPVSAAGRDEVDNPYLPDSVDGVQLIMFVGGGLLAPMAVAAAGPCGGRAKCSLRRRILFDTFMGFAETMSMTYSVTEATKFGFGRLRPDFLDRYERFDCATHPDRAECVGGRLSFTSGHASMAMASATYAMLSMGGQLVWGADARRNGDWTTRSLGIVGQTAFMAAAFHVAWSRTQDNRHHSTDVLAGSLIGIGLANLSYWTYFNTEGLPRGALPTRASVSPVPGGLMIGLGGDF